MGAHLPGRLKIALIKRYSDGVGNTVVLREVPCNRRGTRHGCTAHVLGECRTSTVKPGTVGADHGFSKFEQFRATRHTGIELRPDQSFEIDLKTVLTSTLTEEPGVMKRSVEAVVERRHTPGDDLGLRTRQPFVVLVLVVNQLV